MSIFSRVRDAYGVLVEKKASPSAADAFVIPGSTLGTDLKVKPFEEAGVTGLLRTRAVGYVYEEWLSELSTSRAKLFYREMRDQDAVLGAIFFALEMILRKADWRVDPASENAEDVKIKEFIEDPGHLLLER